MMALYTGACDPSSRAVSACGIGEIVSFEEPAAEVVPSPRERSDGIQLQWLGLPCELIRHILKQCDPWTLLGLRSVCKCLEKHVRDLLTSKAFERHVSLWFISEMIYYSRVTKLLVNALLQHLELCIFTLAGEYPIYSWQFVTKCCSCPEPFNDDGSNSLLADLEPCTECLAFEWDFWLLAPYELRIAPPVPTGVPRALLRGLCRAFGRNLLVKLYFLMAHDLKCNISCLEETAISYPAVYKGLNNQIRGRKADLQSYVTPFDFECYKDYELKLDELKREVLVRMRRDDP